MTVTTGTASSVTDFFSQLRTFAAANAGFSNQGTTTINGFTVHHLSKGGIFWNFEETLTFIGSGFTINYARMRMTYTKPNDSETYNQLLPAGQERYTGMNFYDSTGPFTSHTFYTEGTAVHAVIEVFPNVFNHLSFGNVQKIGTWVGGEYLTAGAYQRISSGILQFTSNNCQHVFADDFGSGTTTGVGTGFNAQSASFVRYVQTGNNNDDFSPMGNMGVFSNQRCRLSARLFETADPSVMYAELLVNSPNQANLRTALFPMQVRIRDYTANSPVSRDAYFIGGIIPGVRVCSVKELNAYEIINTDWQTFPVIQKSGSSLVAPITSSIGFAYQRVT